MALLLRVDPPALLALGVIYRNAALTALHEYNETADDPLYLMQGVWINENHIAELEDPYADDARILNDFIQDGKDLVDIFHGNATLPERPGFASGTYDVDISEYVIGWILGIEWDPGFVLNTNEAHADKAQYDGQFLHTENASPFEMFLSEGADRIMTYEAETYSATRPLSFTNWLTPDPLDHPNEPDPNEDMVSVNVEHIKLRDPAFAGQFASYHIYPYYPEFMNYSPEYTAFKEDGRVNTYKAYLRDLKSFHDLPVLVAEFGVPSSRGKAHDARFSGFNQGNLSEEAQGEALVSMTNDIVDEGYMGALIFAFQDEWFKRTWNTMDYSLPWRRPFWNDVETNEQFFGLLSFDPGETTAVHLDGDKSEWNESDRVAGNETHTLYVQHDARYLYLMVETDAADIRSREVFVPIDTIQGQGNHTSEDHALQFSRGADFLLHIKNGASRLTVDPYYDVFNHQYGTVLDMVEPSPYGDTVDSGHFKKMYHALSSKLELPMTDETIPFQKYETGALKEGLSDPSHEAFDSLSDYYYGDGFVEVRLPWLLLNIMDPSTKMMIDDFQGARTFTPTPYEAIHLGAGDSTSVIEFGAYTYEDWQMPSYHERLKESYPMVQDAFSKID